MMTAAEVIAELDRALDETGQDVVLRRYTAPTGNPRPKIDLPARAFVRPLEPEELVGTMDSAFSKVIISPTGSTDLLPFVKGDKVVVDGRERNVEAPKPYRYRNELARIVLVVAG